MFSSELGLDDQNMGKTESLKVTGNGGYGTTSCAGERLRFRAITKIKISRGTGDGNGRHQ